MRPARRRGRGRPRRGRPDRGALTTAQVDALEAAGLGRHPADRRGRRAWATTASRRRAATDGRPSITGLPDRRASTETVDHGHHARDRRHASSASSSSAPAACGWCGATSPRSSGWPHTATQVLEPAAGLRRRRPRRTRPGRRHRPPHRGRPGGPGAQRHARQRRGRPAARGTTASNGCASSSPTPRHELRTPLASIRGYAELSRREREPVPEGVTHALSRVESEAMRMQGSSRTCCCSPGSTPAARWTARPSTCPLLAVDAVSDAHAAVPRPPLGARPARRAGRGLRRPGPAAPGRGQPARQRPHAHAPRAPRVVMSSPRRRRGSG